MQFSLLGSGSSGNAMFIRGARTKFLIDAGLSLKQLQTRLAIIGESLDGLAGVVITHEHGDHVNGLGVLARKFDVPVFITAGTAAHLPPNIGEIPTKVFFESGGAIEIGEFVVSSFAIAHDAVDPVSFVVSAGGCRLGMATDLGHVTELVRQRLKGSHALVLESNYCPEMIRQSSYPPQIVQRIRGKHGHLSNPDMNSLLAHLLHDELQWVVATHVSQENNTEEKARAMATQAMRGHPAQLFVAAHDAPTPLFRIEPRRVRTQALERSA